MRLCAFFDSEHFVKGKDSALHVWTVKRKEVFSFSYSKIVLREVARLRLDCLQLIK